LEDWFKFYFEIDKEKSLLETLYSGLLILKNTVSRSCWRFCGAVIRTESSISHFTTLVNAPFTIPPKESSIPSSQLKFIMGMYLLDSLYIVGTLETISPETLKNLPSDTYSIDLIVLERVGDILQFDSTKFTSGHQKK
jgi:hypothetical protein